MLGFIPTFILFSSSVLGLPHLDERGTKSVCASALYAELIPVLKDFPAAQSFCKIARPIKDCSSVGVHQRSASPPTPKAQDVKFRAQTAAFAKLILQAKGITSTFCSCIQYSQACSTTSSSSSSSSSSSASSATSSRSTTTSTAMVTTTQMSASSSTLTATTTITQSNVPSSSSTMLSTSTTLQSSIPSRTISSTTTADTSSSSSSSSSTWSTTTEISTMTILFVSLKRFHWKRVLIVYRLLQQQLLQRCRQVLQQLLQDQFVTKTSVGQNNASMRTANLRTHAMNNHHVLWPIV